MGPTPPPGPDPCLVLIVDDEIAIAEVIAAIVAEAGHTPVVVPNGRRALDVAAERWPALLVVDLMMPLLDGVGLLAELRAKSARARRPMPPVIVTTAGGLRAARAIGADALLPKP